MRHEKSTLDLTLEILDSRPGEWIRVSHLTCEHNPRYKMIPTVSTRIIQDLIEAEPYEFEHKYSRGFRYIRRRVARG